MITILTSHLSNLLFPSGGGMIGRAVVLYYITTTVLASVQGALATRYIIVPFTSTVNASEVCSPFPPTPPPQPPLTPPP